MHLTKARELREERARKIAEARAIYDKSGRTKEDETKFDAIMAEADQLKTQIDREERLDEAEIEVRKSGAPPSGAIDPGADPTQKDAGKQKRYREVWKRAMCFDGPAEHGFRGISTEDRSFLREFRDMGTGGGNALQGTGGGYFVPVGFVDDVEIALKYYGDMLNVATIMNTATGQPLPYPTANDTTTVGALVGESQQVSEADVSLGNVTFGAYKYSSNMVKVSIELLQDSAFDLDSFLKEMFATRIGRILNTHFTSGTGSNQPTGILTAAVTSAAAAASASLTYGLAVTATGAATNDGGAETGGATIGSDDLTNLEHAIDPLYRRGAIYVMHDMTLKTIKKVKDKYGRPLWLPGLSVKAPDTILDYEYSVNNDMPTIAVNAKTVIFGQVKKYMVRRVKEISVLRLVERYADYGQVGFVAFARYDGQLLDAGTHPVTYLVQAAS
jgi:HK97 family phage major capsid protein